MEKKFSYRKFHIYYSTNPTSNQVYEIVWLY